MSQKVNEFNSLINIMKQMLYNKQTIYDFNVQTTDGKDISLKEYNNKVVLIVNVASYCKFTTQYKELQALYEKYNNDGFEILAFPCNQFLNQEPDDNETIQSFCELNYQTTFPIFSKIEVNGTNAHPLYKYLKNQSRGFLCTSFIKWNFTKFLINKDGQVVKRYSPIIQPFSIENDIQNLLN